MKKFNVSVSIVFMEDKIVEAKTQDKADKKGLKQVKEDIRTGKIPPEGNALEQVTESYEV